MNLDLDTAAAEWLAAKAAEKAAVERRRALEDHMVSLIGLAESFEGTETSDTGTHRIKVAGRMNRKVDAEKIQEIAAEHGIAELLPVLFRWKPELNVAAWKATPEATTRPLLGGLTTEPGRPAFTITKGDDK